MTVVVDVRWPLLLPPELDGVIPMFINGTLYAHMDDKNRTLPLACDEAMRELSVRIGAHSAVVNYRAAVKPYLGALLREAEAQEVAAEPCASMPQQYVALQGKVLELSVSGGHVVTRAVACPTPMPLRISGLQPISMAGLEDSLASRPEHVAMSRPFGHPEDYRVLLWLVGNSIVEPNTNTKVLACLAADPAASPPSSATWRP